MKYEIRRTFPGKLPLSRGEVVEDPKWKNIPQLLRTGYIREVKDTEQKVVVQKANFASASRRKNGNKQNL